MARWQLDRVNAEGVLHHQFAAVVLVRIGEEQRRRKIGPYSRTVGPRLTDGIVHVIAERLSAAVAVEQWREHTQRQRRRDEQRVSAQRIEDDLTNLPRYWMILRQLHVVLGACRL